VIESLIYLLVVLLVLGVIWYAIRTLVPLPEPIGRVVQIVFVLIVVIVVIYFLLGFAGTGPGTMRLR
jgi:hypothetical protein